MAGTVIVDTINSSVSGTPPVFQANGTEIGTLCRAWVNFNGIGTVAIRASFNVSSITDNGTGNYTINFTTAMPDANYGLSSGQSGGDTTRNNVILQTLTTASVRVTTNRMDDSSLQDTSIVCVSIFR
jgi:hypothetical protein